MKNPHLDAKRKVQMYEEKGWKRSCKDELKLKELKGSKLYMEGMTHNLLENI
jgi:hypothetical protein